METRTEPVLLDARGIQVCFKHAMKRAQRGEEITLAMKDPTAEWCGCEDCTTETTREEKQAHHEINVAWIEVFLRNAIVEEQTARYCQGQDPDDLPTKSWMRIAENLIKAFKKAGLLAEGIEVR